MLMDLESSPSTHDLEIAAFDFDEVAIDD